jgi:type IV pilus assembly protein PilY1
MRRTHVQFASLLVAGALLGIAGRARAQDTQFMPSDVLLLVDTSGSMARTTFRENGQFASPKCGTWAQPKRVEMNAAALEDAGHTWTAPDRWSMLVKVLTGTPTDVACVAQERTDPLFLQEYALGATPSTGAAPIDSKYYLPYNRIVARPGTGNACTPAPSWDATVRTQLNDDALSWPTASGGPVYWREIGAFTGANPTCSFTAQDVDGLLDAYGDRARFGLMTFDSMPAWDDKGTKKIGTGIINGSYDANYPPGIGDTWSYFPSWLTDTAPVPAGAGQGNFGSCLATGSEVLWENGSRNPAAPPWEGRLLTFGKPNATTAEMVAWNERVQNALLTARPYGQTPIAAMLADAKTFLLDDNNNIDPYVGGKIDTAFKTTLNTGCRKRKVILFTDGGPNWDMRPQCELKTTTPPGNCPYPLSQDTAKVLADNNIPVYVVGLSVSNGAKSCKEIFDAEPAKCNTLTACDTNCAATKCSYGYCLNDPIPAKQLEQEALSQCCVVKAIAEKGGTTAPYFVENQAELAAAFGDILKIAVTSNKSRTVPVAAGLSQATGAIKNPQEPGLVGGRFFSSFHDVDYDLLAGSITRQRYDCAADGKSLSEAQDLKTDKGDYFGIRVDVDRKKRLVYTVAGDTKDGKVLSDRSIRPLYNSAPGDGLGAYGGTMVSGEASVIAQNTSLDLAMLGANKSCDDISPCCWATPLELKPKKAACRERFLQEELGLKVEKNTDITFLRQSAFGAVLHAYPVVVEAPSEITSDTSYLAFKSGFAKRGSMMYAPTVDGQLHAFHTWQVDLLNNEAWTFIPPAVLPMIERQFQDRFKGTSQYLLDGPLMVRDVAGTAKDPATNRFLTRTLSNAKNPGETRWYTILLGSFGKFGGYYAMDVSWPDPKSTDNPPTGYTKGPRFLWQLTTDEDGAPLFGDNAGTPSIATLYFKMPGSNEAAAEHAVAILPGGLGGQPTNTVQSVTFSAPGMVEGTSFTPRGTTRAYQPLDSTANNVRALGGARSVTIVRLDTGEVVRTLRYGPVPGTPQAADMQAPQKLYDNKRITNAPFDAPISGQVMSYPAGAGTVADRAYVGDAEGRMWRINLSNPDPANWDASMFFDAYPQSGAGGMAYAWNDAKPIKTAPVISTDSFGHVVVLFSAGDQDNFETVEGKYLVWSLMEKVDTTGLKTYVNWYLNEKSGQDENASASPTGCTNVNPQTPAPDATRFGLGERVLGPLALFNSTVYFTTYDPKKADPTSCSAAYSYLWGVHYITAGTDPKVLAGGKPEEGPQPRLVPDSSDPNAKQVRYKVLCPGSIAFGATVSQQPSCVADPQSSTGDSFLMGGTHYTMSQMTPGPVQLMVQAGKPVQAGQTAVTTINIPTPTGGASIDSWATIVE